MAMTMIRADQNRAVIRIVQSKMTEPNVNRTYIGAPFEIGKWNCDASVGRESSLRVNPLDVRTQILEADQVLQEDYGEPMLEVQLKTCLSIVDARNRNR